jgi:hypothetical protein
MQDSIDKRVGEITAQQSLSKLIEKTEQFINSFLGDVVYDRYETAKIK